MRTFEERRAEVYRRSEERIHMRKNRRRIVLTCIPVLLCVAVGFLWQPMTTADNAAAEDAYYSAEEFAVNGSIICSDVLVEVQGAQAEDYWRSADWDVIVEISNAIHAVIREDTEGGIRQDVAADTKNETESGYTITFTDRQGVQIVYVLTDHQLTALETGLVYDVSAEALAALKTALGLQ